MKFIKVNCVYGHRIGNITRQKNPKSPPFQVSDEKATELVERGIAVVVEKSAATDPKKGTGENQNNGEFDGITVPDLKKIAEPLGIDIKAVKKRDDLIAAILKARENDPLPPLEDKDPDPGTGENQNNGETE